MKRIRNLTVSIPLLVSIGSFWAAPALADICGMVGSVKERLHDCARLDTGEGKTFLVMNDGAFEIRMDAFGLLWGDLLGNGDRRIKAGKLLFPEQADTACSGVTAALGYPGIEGVDWRLPTADEFARIGELQQRAFNRTFAPKPKIFGDESWRELSSMEETAYWTSSVPASGDRWAFEGGAFVRPEGPAFARCVGTW